MIRARDRRRERHRRLECRDRLARGGASEAAAHPVCARGLIVPCGGVRLFQRFGRTLGRSPLDTCPGRIDLVDSRPAGEGQAVPRARRKSQAVPKFPLRGGRARCGRSLRLDRGALRARTARELPRPDVTAPPARCALYRRSGYPVGTSWCRGQAGSATGTGGMWKTSTNRSESSRLPVMRTRPLSIASAGLSSPVSSG